MGSVHWSSRSAMALVVATSSCCLSLTHKFSLFQNKLKPFSSFSSLRLPSIPSKLLQPVFTKASLSTDCSAQEDEIVNSPVGSPASRLPFSGLEDVMLGYMFGKKKATEVAHSVWKNVVRKGDVVVDATCGNGYDTLALVRLIADDSRRGRVYAMDLQKSALESTSSLLHQSVTADEKELVELYATCHSEMEEIIPNDANARLVAFNLGYLPGGDKRIKTEKETTLLALEASKRIIAPGGLISIIAYLGHSGGREEFEKVESFAAELPLDQWFCSKLQTLNRPLAPVLILLYKK